MLKPTATDKVPVRFKVRLCTTNYKTVRGVSVTKDLHFYKKPNPEHLPETFIEDLYNGRTVEELIIDFNSYADGIYELSICGMSYDRDGYIDDWDWRLDPW